MFKSEEQAIEAFLITGASSACFYLVAQYQQMVYGICFKILRDKNEAEEAAQDAFIKFFESLARLEERSKAKYWLLSIAYRTAIDYSRKRKNKPIGIEAMDKEPYAQEIDVYTAIETKQNTGVLQKVFDSTGETEGAILAMFYIEGIPVKEIAEITGLTVSNVKIKLMRTREKLRDKLALHYKK